MSTDARLRLAIDCSTPHLALALVDEHGVTVASTTTEVGRQHAALITVGLTALFERAGVPRTAVVQVRCGIGPGSYTGVRVAVAAAKGLGRAWGVDVEGVYSLLAQVGDAVALGERAVVSVDARKGNVYAQPCTRRAGAAGAGATVVSLGAPLKLAAATLAERFPGWHLVAGEQPDAALLAATDDTAAAEPLYL